MTTKAELQATVDALMSRMAAMEASFRDQTTIPTPQTATTTTVVPAAPQTPIPVSTPSQITGVVQKVAVHGLGLRLESVDRWYNVKKDGKPIFHQVKAGQHVRLDLNDTGRVTMAYVVQEGATAPSAPAATTTAPAATTTPSDNSRVAKDGSIRPPCPFCHRTPHNQYKTTQVRDECIIRQYQTATGNDVPDMTVPETMAAFGAWVRANAPLKAFAFNKAGFILVGEAPPKTVPAKAAASPAARSLTPAEIAAVAATLESVPVDATTASPAALPKAAPSDPKSKSGAGTGTAETVVVTTVSAAIQDGATTAGTSTEKPAPTPSSFIAGRAYKGLIAQQARNTPGLVKFMCAEVPGPKGSGVWLQASAKLTPAIVKLNVNDRVAFEFGYIQSSDGTMVLGIVRAKLLGDASKETGVTPGVETSGKNAPAAPHTQPTDSKVKAERQKRAAAKRAISEDAKSAATTAGTLVA